MTDKKIEEKVKTEVKIESIENSQQKITVTIKFADAKKYLEVAKKKVMTEADIKGFRKGQVPESVFIAQFGNFPIYQELAYTLVDKTYTDVLIENKVQAIGRPEISVIDFGEDKDVVYEMIFDVMPTVTLGDYMKLHSEFPEVKHEDVTEFDVDEAVKDIIAWRKQKPGQIESPSESNEDVKELTEEEVKSMGIESGLVFDLRNKLKTNLKEEKEFKAKDLRRNQIISKLIDETKGEMPKSFVDNELLKIKDRIIGDLSNMGVTFADYLKHMKKSESEWMEGEREQAKKNAKLQIALLEISKKEKVAPSDVAVEAEVTHLKLHYRDIDEARLREYSRERMTNTFVLEYVMTGKLPDEKEMFKVDHSHDEEVHQHS
jgi:FKBP-type peptidyl-prolyl cis-trans isomerase (trigger factor)